MVSFWRKFSAPPLSLDAIGAKYGTDKSSQGKPGKGHDAGHDYLRVYEKFLAPLRNAPIKVLEIGVQAGNSVRMWEEYFPNAIIYGLDIRELARASASRRIHVELVDQGDEAAMKGFCKKSGPFDFIIEDGSHLWKHQIANIKWLIPYVKPGGVYIVEDLNTSYAKSGFGAPGEQTAVDYVKQCAEQIMSGGKVTADGAGELHKHVETMMILRHAAVFFKR